MPFDGTFDKLRAIRWLAMSEAAKAESNGGSGGARTQLFRHAFLPKNGLNHAYLNV